MSEPVSRVEFFRPPLNPNGGGTVYLRPAGEEDEGRSAPGLRQEVEPIVEVRVGDKVRFYGEKQRFTVQAVSSDGRWAAATKPYNPQRTVLYTVMDMRDRVRGRENCYGLGYESREDCENAIGMFERGEVEHSHRFPPIPLEVVEIVRCGDQSGPCASTECVS